MIMVLTGNIVLAGALSAFIAGFLIGGIITHKIMRKGNAQV